MSERVITIDELRARIGEGITVAALDRREWQYIDLSDVERKYIMHVFNTGLAHVQKVSPVIAASIARQANLVLEAASIAKATFPTRKNYSFPSVPGSLGVAWIFPQAIKYSTTTPTSYNTNSWDIPITAGTAAYFFGSAASFYKTSSTDGQRTFLLIFQDGVVEYGTTPSIQQFRLISEAKVDYGIYTVDPLVELPVEKNVTVYQYPTPMGALMIDFNRGVKWSFMPMRSGTATIKLLGMVFYEHDFASDLKWVT